MNARRPSLAPALPTGLIVLAGLAVLGTGCDDARPTHVREDRVASTLALAPQTSVRIETRTADVHLVPSPDDTVRVLTVKRVQSMSDRSVEAMWKQIHVTVERSGKELILRVREPERGTGHVTVEAGPWRIRRRVEIELTVAVPAGRAVSFLTERGDVDAHDLKQDLTLDLSSGDAQVYDLSGGALKVQSTAGDVSVRRARQPVTIRSTSGDVECEDLIGPVTVRATSGDVTLDRIEGRVAVETSSGDTDVLDVNGNVWVSTSSGDATVRAHSDSLVVETSSGDQEVTLVGAARYISLKSSSGEIALMIPKGTGGALDVQTATGAMSVSSTIQIGTMTRNHLTGDLGGKGQTLIRSSSGDIRLSTTESQATAEGGSK